MTNPIDLSKYAKGRNVRYVDRVQGWDDSLVVGTTYTITHHSDDGFLGFAGVNRAYTFNPTRFVPVEDEAPVAGFAWTQEARSEIDRSYRNAISGQWLNTEPESPATVTDYAEALNCVVNATIRQMQKETTAPPVAASPKVDHNATCSCGKPFHKHDGIGGNRCNACGERAWDSSKYAGLDAPTYQQLSTLDKRIAVARAELDLGTAERMKRMAGPRHPPEGRSCRVYRSNRR